MKTLEQKYGSAHLALDTRWIEGHDEESTPEQCFQAWEEILIREYEVRENYARICSISPDKARRYDYWTKRALSTARAAAEKYLEQAFCDGAAWEEQLAVFHREFEQLEDYSDSEL